MVLFDPDLTLERPCTTEREKTDRSPPSVSVTAWKYVTGHLHIDPTGLDCVGARAEQPHVLSCLVHTIGSKTPPQAFLQLWHHTLKVILYLTSSFMSGFHLFLLLRLTETYHSPLSAVWLHAQKAEPSPFHDAHELSNPKPCRHTLLRYCKSIVTMRNFGGHMPWVAVVFSLQPSR